MFGLTNSEGNRGEDVREEYRYFDVTVEYAKAAPDDILMQVTARNRGPDAAVLHILPQLCARNTWSWVAGYRRALC